MIRWQAQAVRYGLVGIGSNVMLYAAYLLITGWGVGHKTAMSGLYLLGMLQTFLFNKRWSFGYRGSTGPSLVRYLAAYAFGYLLNLSILHVFVDILGMSHSIIQGAAIVVVAGALFVLQRYWVFAPRPQVTDAGRYTTRG